jgi:hypothetical protein
MFLSGLAGKRGSGLEITLNTSERIAADDKSDHDFIYSVSSSKTGND